MLGLVSEAHRMEPATLRHPLEAQGARSGVPPAEQMQLADERDLLLACARIMQRVTAERPRLNRAERPPAGAS
jgi:hypothetical protein